MKIQLSLPEMSAVMRMVSVFEKFIKIQTTNRIALGNQYLLLLPAQLIAFWFFAVLIDRQCH